MPWNEPGNNGKKPDPWNNNRGDGPPDLDKIISEFFKKIRQAFSGNKNPSSWQPTGKKETGYILSMVLAVLVIAWALSGIFIVNPAEEAVILRFGKYADVVQPGLHWFARFIDTKYLVDIQKIYSFSLQGDFLTKSSEQNDNPTQVIPDTQKKAAISSDQSKNLVNVELNVQYRINNARNYLFNVVNPDDTIQQVAEGALSAVVGTMKLDDVLTTGRESLSLGVQQRVTQVLASYNIGLEVVAVTLKKVQAPDQVKAAFNDVNRADQDRATFIQQAQAYASKVVPIAQGGAARVLADAKGYQQQVVLGAEANIAKYQALLKVYTQFPDVTRERMYLEAMQTILQNTTKVVIDGQGNNLLYLPLDKLVQQHSQDEPNNTNGIVPSTSLLSSNELISGSNVGEIKNDTN